MTEKEKQTKQTHFPKFTFDDVLALQCCMETVKKVQEDKELYEKLNLIHSKMYDAYRVEKQDKQASLQNNKNIDLTKILKDCPVGWELYSSVLGEVTFKEIIDDEDYPITVYCENWGSETFTAEGKLYIKNNSECILFPSKEQRDWSKFTAPWYNHKEKKKTVRFDPNILKAFDKVIVRKAYALYWSCDLFSYNYIDFNGDNKSVCIGDNYSYCIPYNDDTKHLVGTTDEAPEYYRYWED